MILDDLQPYIEGIIWSADKLNLKYIQEFNNLIYRYFGKDVYKDLQEFTRVDNTLRDCFTGIEPSPTELNNYLDKFM